MARAYYVESTQKAFEYTRCMKCGELIATIGDGRGFWNVNGVKGFRNICSNCHNVMENKKNTAFQKWKDDSAALERRAALSAHNMIDTFCTGVEQFDTDHEDYQETFESVCVFLLDVINGGIGS